jgi:hypothetical protein
MLGNKRTEDDIPAELVKIGIPKTDIVAEVDFPFKHQFTEYATS